MNDQITFDGPRPLLPSEELEGRKLFVLSFWDEVPEDLEIETTGNIDGWHVMVPESGPFQGKPVSQIRTEHHEVRLGGGRLLIGSIGGVCTHPEFRGMGLAGRVLTHCAQQLKDEGARLMLISGDRGLYTRTGNVPAMKINFFVLKADEIQAQSANPYFKMRSMGTADAPVYARIYQDEAVGYIRKLDDCPDPGDPTLDWVVEMDGTPAAYFFITVPWRQRGKPDTGIREVWEYGGSRFALAAGISQLLEENNGLATGVPICELRFHVSWQDVELRTLLNAAGGESSRVPLLGHTMRLINFDGLRQDLEAYIQARLTKDLYAGLRFEQTGPLLVDPDLGERAGDRCAIVWNDARLELSTAQMTQLVMGSWDFDVGDVEPPLDEVVKALFPLPSFIPGINYR